MTRTPNILARVAHTSALVVAILSVLFGGAGSAFAGFGITPPYVNNDRLTRGSTFEQTITLVRSDPAQALHTSITLNIPGGEGWVSIDRVLDFTMPGGETQVPIVVREKVPANAEYKEYRGAIRVRTA